MAGRGRGRGGNNALTREINERMGGAPSGNDSHVETVFEPPPLFPPLENRPVPLDLGVEGEYLLALKRDFVEYFRDSPSFLQNISVKADIQRYSDRYQTTTLASRTTSDLVQDWSLFPKELKENTNKAVRKKRKLGSSTGKNKILKKSEDITNRLEELEKREEEGSDAEGEGADADGNKAEKEENKDADSDAEEEVADEDLDEEMDDGTDYINNYFDNGEDYLDEEDDNLDDGPTY